MSGLGARALRALPGLLRASAPYLIPAIVLDAIYVSGILEATGGQLVPALDDAFIHFEYGRALAEGRPLVYVEGDAPTTGATSLLYMALLAIGWLLGLRGLAMGWCAHAIAIGSLATSAWAARRLGDRWIGPPAGWTCAALVFAIPQYVFMAFGGMEIALLTASVLLATWTAVRVLDAPALDARHAITAAIIGALAAASRPEGALAALAVTIAIACARTRHPVRAIGLLALVPAGVPGLIALVTTGQSRTNGQIAKWLFANPYFTRADAWALTREHVGQLVTYFDGDHDRYAVAPLFSYVALGGAAVAVVAIVRRHKGLRGILPALFLPMALAGVAIPTTYGTFDTNYARYLFPFMPIAAIAGGLGVVAIGRALEARGARQASGILAALFVAYCVARPEASYERFVASPTEIAQQHLPMAAHVRALPRSAVVAVTDAGALRYLGRRRTYDLIGLTTPGAASAWAAGQGSAFERLERLPPARRPTHLASYPTWSANLPLGSARIAVATLPRADHVGGTSMELWRVRTELYGSGATPADPPAGHLVDELDVADLVSERAHGYAFDVGSYGGNRMLVDGDVADGARLLAGEERFRLRARPGMAATLIARARVRTACELELRWNGAPLARLELPAAPGWTERAIAIPAERTRDENTIERVARCPDGLDVAHDWLFQDEARAALDAGGGDG